MTLRKINGVFYACFTGKNGARKRVSTRCTDKTEARKVAVESGIAELEMAAKAGRLTREAIGHIVSGKRITMDKCLAPFEEYLKACARSPKTIANNLTFIRCWLRAGALGDAHPHTITANHIADFINDPQNDTKHSSRVIALSCIRSLFSFLAANGWVTHDVSRMVRVGYTGMTHEQKEATPRKPFTEAEVFNLLEYLENNDETFWHFAVLCSSETGLRLSDICQLEWSCFGRWHALPETLTVWTDKTNTRVAHIISPELQRVTLRLANRTRDTTNLFPEQREIILDVKRRNLLSIQFKRICDGLGIKGKSFHCLRHAAACNKRDENSESKLDLAKRLVDVLDKKEIAKMLGHSNTKTTESYLH